MADARGDNDVGGVTTAAAAAADVIPPVTPMAGKEAVDETPSSPPPVVSLEVPKVVVVSTDDRGDFSCLASPFTQEGTVMGEEGGSGSDAFGAAPEIKAGAAAAVMGGSNSPDVAAGTNMISPPPRPAADANGGSGEARKNVLNDTARASKGLTTSATKSKKKHKQPSTRSLYERSMQRLMDKERNRREARNSEIPSFTPILVSKGDAGGGGLGATYSSDPAWERLYSRGKEKQRSRKNGDGADGGINDDCSTLSSKSNPRSNSFVGDGTGNGTGGAEQKKNKRGTSSKPEGTPRWERLYEKGKEKNRTNLRTSKLTEEEKEDAAAAASSSRQSSSSSSPKSPSHGRGSNSRTMSSSTRKNLASSFGAGTRPSSSSSTMTSGSSRIDRLYETGREKVSRRSLLPRDEQEAARKRLEEEELQRCTFAPKLNWKGEVGDGGTGSRKSRLPLPSDKSCVSSSKSQRSLDINPSEEEVADELFVPSPAVANGLSIAEVVTDNEEIAVEETPAVPAGKTLGEAEGGEPSTGDTAKKDASEEVVAKEDATEAGS